MHSSEGVPVSNIPGVTGDGEDTSIMTIAGVNVNGVHFTKDYFVRLCCLHVLHMYAPNDGRSVKCGQCLNNWTFSEGNGWFKS